MTNLYLDMNIYNRPFDDQSQMRIRLETVAITMIFTLIESGHFSTRWSFVLEYENSRNPFPERRAYVRYMAQSCEAQLSPMNPSGNWPNNCQRGTRFEAEMRFIWHVQSCRDAIIWLPAMIV